MKKDSVKPWMALALLLCGSGAVVLTLAFLRRALADLPSVETLTNYTPPLVTRVVDTNGLSVGEFFTERRITVPLTQIPIDLRRAVMAIEDTDFYRHWGINLKAIIRAGLANFRAGRLVQGGSTLTQQLAKTIFLTRDRTFDRKFKELLLTLEIEHRYSKDEILQLYLNQIYFGGGAYGVESAARLYFGKHARELTLPECALLAGLIRSPNRYSPVNNIDLARDRRATVLRRMQDLTFISAAEAKQANASPIQPAASAYKIREAPYFLEEIRKVLEPIYGSEMLEQGGLAIQTTLDLRLQRVAQEVLEKHLSAYDLKYGTATLVEYRRDLMRGTTQAVEVSTTAPKVQGALIAIDVHTGAIRAMVGGRDFFSSQFNRAIQAKRQPGSSFKPFVYGAALQDGFTAASVLDDGPIVFKDVASNPELLAETTTYADTSLAILSDLGITPADFAAKKRADREEMLKDYWRPQNFDGKFLGSITLRRALARSRNLVSVRLVDKVGPAAVVRFAKRAGIESGLAPVLSLALGTSVVDLEELTSAYGTLASGGLHAEAFFLERVSDAQGRTLLQNTPKIESRLDPQSTFLTVHLMKGVVEGGTGWYAQRLGRPLAGKTGTTQDQRDLLFVGFSPDLVCGVWIGYDDFRPLKHGLSSSIVAVPLWTDFMREALKNDPVKDFTVPAKIEFAKVDADTGYLALPTCPKVILEAFREGTVPSEFCPVDHQANPVPSDKQELE